MKIDDETRALAFDWGGTLMLEDRRYSGAMLDWPEVKAVEGIQDALEKLSGHYAMVVVTNAANSNAEQVRAALKRVGLADYFAAIFTFGEVNARKPEPAFFRRVEAALGTRPGQMIMVGDDFWADIVGARQAGWKAAWYTPQGRACPGLIPPHQAELLRMSDLPAALQRVDLPDLQTCHLWCLEQDFSFNAWAHVSLVAGVAYLLAVRLRGQGLGVDPLLAQRGGLLHDIAKMTTLHLGTKANHGEVGASLLNERGQPALAEIARRHMIYPPDSVNWPRTWEEKLVHYADRLAEGSQLVPLDQRLEALYLRYPKQAAFLRQQRENQLALEAEIAAAAGVSPNELFPLIQQALKGNG